MSKSLFYVNTLYFLFNKPSENSLPGRINSHERSKISFLLAHGGHFFFFLVELFFIGYKNVIYFGGTFLYRVSQTCATYNSPDLWWIFYLSYRGPGDRLLPMLVQVTFISVKNTCIRCLLFMCIQDSSLYFARHSLREKCFY